MISIFATGSHRTSAITSPFEAAVVSILHLFVARNQRPLLRPLCTVTNIAMCNSSNRMSLPAFHYNPLHFPLWPVCEMGVGTRDMIKMSQQPSLGRCLILFSSPGFPISCQSLPSRNFLAYFAIASTHVLWLLYFSTTIFFLLGFSSVFLVYPRCNCDHSNLLSLPVTTYVLV